MTLCVSICIVNYNTSSMLAACLESISKLRGDFVAETYVADNHSTDGSVEMVQKKFPWVRVHRFAENVGFTKAVNVVARMGKGDFLLLLHPDVEVSVDSVERMIQFFKAHSRAGILGGNLYYGDGTPNSCEIVYPDFKGEMYVLLRRTVERVFGADTWNSAVGNVEWSHEKTQKVNWVWNACMMIRKQVWEQIGGFDEAFYVWFSDWDFCKRARDAGWDSYYVKDAVVVHHERRSFQGPKEIGEGVRYKIDGWRSAQRQIADRFVFLKKHLKPSSMRAVKGLYVVRNVIKIGVTLLEMIWCRRDWDETRFRVGVCLRTVQGVLKG